MEDIELKYELNQNDPPFLGVVGQLAVAILSGIGQALVTAGTTAAKDLLAMFTVERLTASLTKYAREQAGVWATKTILDAGAQEWLGSMLHAFGLDMEDLLGVTKNALDRGFQVMTESILDGFTKAGLGTGSIPIMIADALGIHQSETKKAIYDSARITREAFSAHAKATADAYAQWTLFQAQNYAAEEEKTRATLTSIWTDTEDKIRTRSRLSTEENISTARDKIYSDIERTMPELIKIIGRVLRPLQDFLNSYMLAARNEFFYLLVPKIPVSYEHVGVAALGALGSAFGLGLVAHMLSLAADLMHPLKATGFPQLAAFVADMAGFGAIARATWYTDVTNFLAIPYRHYSLRYFRPTLPRESEVIRLYAENCIREEDFERAMQYWGYSDAWITAYKRNVFRDPRHLELSMIADDADISPSWVYHQLRDAGYSPDDSGPLADAIIRKSLRTYREQYRRELVNLFAAGYISEDILDKQLEPLELRTEAHMLTKKIARFKYIYEFTEESAKMLVDMYDKDLIDEDDLEIGLTGLGIVPERRTLIVNRARVKKRGRVAREEKAEVKKQIRKRQALIEDIYILAYRVGALTEDGLLAALQFAGIDYELATLTVELEKQKRMLAEKKKLVFTAETEKRRIQKKYEAGYISLFRKDLIDAETLRQFLRDIELEEDYITAIIETETYRKLKPEPIEIG